MLCSNKTIIETLSLLREHMVRDFILCPGSRNAGIVHSVCQVDDFCVHTATDERSAGFMAIGMALATGKAVAVVVTSGSALANLYPAACEAYYQHIPVVFISADRPLAWIGQMDGQTMPQEGALGKMVKMSVSLPENNLWHANRLVNEAMLECQERFPQGPVHINIPISEPIYDFSTEELPMARVIHLRNTIPSISVDVRKRSIIVAGQMSPHEIPAFSVWKKVAQHFCIIAESLSNIPQQLYTNATIIDWNKMESLDLVITVGGHIINKDLKQFLRSHSPKEHWHVSDDGAIADLFCCQTMAIQAKTEDFLNNLVSQTREAYNKPITLPLKNTLAKDYRIELLERFFSLIQQKSAVHLANSSSVRLAQYAKKTGNSEDFPRIFCNRGINGIEGSLSTAVGYAKASPEQPVYIVIGDLSFLYDQNALWNSPLPNNLHILLLNDGKGGIFDTLPVPKEPTKSRKAITGTHTFGARHIAEHYAIRYLTGKENLEEFINSKETTILEIYETMESC